MEKIILINQLSGSIPNSLGGLSSLTRLHLNSNQLIGSIPESLSNLSSLTHLYLHQLTGSIPKSLGGLSNLERLYLYNNHLCRNIPPSLKRLNSLTSLSLSNNHLKASNSKLIDWLNDKQPGWENSQTASPEYCQPTLVRLDSFMLTLNKKNVTLAWATGTETDNAVFCLWRSIEDGAGSYANITALEELNSHQRDCVVGKLTAVDEPEQLITAVGNSREGACYSFEDTSINEDGTYYYVLEDVDTNGNRTFHCNDMDAITVGQGTEIDLKAAQRFCRQMTGGVK